MSTILMAEIIVNDDFLFLILKSDESFSFLFLTRD
jgi:hypothetical protein